MRNRRAVKSRLSTFTPRDAAASAPPAPPPSPPLPPATSTVTSPAGGRDSENRKRPSDNPTIVPRLPASPLPQRPLEQWSWRYWLRDRPAGWSGSDRPSDLKPIRCNPHEVPLVEAQQAVHSPANCRGRNDGVVGAPTANPVPGQVFEQTPDVAGAEGDRVMPPEVRFQELESDLGSQSMRGRKPGENRVTFGQCVGGDLHRLPGGEPAADLRAHRAVMDVPRAEGGDQAAGVGQKRRNPTTSSHAGRPARRESARRSLRKAGSLLPGAPPREVLRDS